MNLIDTCPAVGHWLRTDDTFDSQEFEDDRGIVTIDERYRIHLRAHRNFLLMQCRVITLPVDATRDAILRQLLLQATERMARERFGLAVDPDGQALWLQALEPATIAPAELIGVVEDFLMAVDALRVTSATRRHRARANSELLA